MLTRVLSLSVFLVVVLFGIGMVGCDLGSDYVPWAERPPENPEPDGNDIGPSVDIQYDLYANVENSIYRFSSDDPAAYEIVATGVTPDNPQFFVTSDGSHIVFTRQTGAVEPDDNDLVLLNINEPTSETILTKSYSAQDMTDEVRISSNHVVYSDHGLLKDYDIATAIYTELNADIETRACNHFPTITQSGLIAFLEQFPATYDGNAHVMTYDGDSHNPTFILEYSSVTFGAQIYPTPMVEEKFVVLSNPGMTGSLELVTDYLGDSPTTETVTIQSSGTDIVRFNAIYQTPLGSKNILYGDDTVFWFDNDDSISGSEFTVSSKNFQHPILRVLATPDESYFILQDEHGIWVYDSSFQQMGCRFEWMNQADSILWMEVK